MDLLPHFTIEEELRTMGSEQLRRERTLILNDLKSLQDQIGDLAFNNYRTYADAGRTTQHCTEIFTEMKDKLRVVSAEVPELASELRTFHTRTKDLSRELDAVQSACHKENLVWELISLPSRMDVCIRAGYYEAAYSLTNYGMMLQQHSIIKNPLIKAIADKLVEARSFLLEELFNKFAGPLDLASSIQVVNNVRKMPYLTPTQLRTCILQHRDMYLDRQILDITNHPEFAIKAIEIYRDCMYDTLVLYLAVFPENEAPRKDLSLDPRWETWPSSAPSSILGQWTARNITRLLDLICRTDMKSSVDMCTVWSKLMSLAASLGRMGLDFRSLVVNTLVKVSLERFTSAVRAATNKFLNETKVLSVSSGEISLLSDGGGPTTGPPQPSPEISMWDDICVYGNTILEALNNLRFTPSPMLIQSVVLCLRDSLRSIVMWLLGHSSSTLFPRAVEIFCLHFVPFIGRCVRFLFPFSAITRLFGTSISPQIYEAFTELDVRALTASCDGGEKIEEVLQSLSSQEKFLPRGEIVIPQQDKIEASQEEISSAAVELDRPKDYTQDFSDTSMCSPPEHDSSNIRFDIGDDPDEAGVEKSITAAVVSPSDEETALSHSRRDLSAADTQLSVVTDDDLPALVDTAPSPFYDETESIPTQECESQNDKKTSEKKEHSKED
nr:Dor1 protein domain containing protein [Haemonchus contortus]